MTFFFPVPPTMNPPIMTLSPAPVIMRVAMFAKTTFGAGVGLGDGAGTAVVPNCVTKPNESFSSAPPIFPAIVALASP